MRFAILSRAGSFPRLMCCAIAFSPPPFQKMAVMRHILLRSCTAHCPSLHLLDLCPQPQLLIEVLLNQVEKEKYLEQPCILRCCDQHSHQAVAQKRTKSIGRMALAGIGREASFFLPGSLLRARPTWGNCLRASVGFFFSSSKAGNISNGIWICGTRIPAVSRAGGCGRTRRGLAPN